MDAGIHDCLDKASRMEKAAFSTWLSIEFARSLEYFVTLVGTQANYIVRAIYISILGSHT